MRERQRQKRADEIRWRGVFDYFWAIRGVGREKRIGKAKNARIKVEITLPGCCADGCYEQSLRAVKVHPDLLHLHVRPT